MSQGCTACDAGTFKQGRGNESCALCPGGTYSSSIASSLCLLCDANTYSEGLGETSPLSCLACPRWQVSSAGSDNLLDCICQAGYTGANGSDCEPCGNGTYKGIVGPSLCQNCTDCVAPEYFYQQYCNETHDAVCHACRVCPPGSYMVRDCEGKYDTICATCPPDTYCYQERFYNCSEWSSSPGGSTSPLNCTCDPGFYGPAGGPCLVCPNGSYCFGAVEIPCPANSFSVAMSDDLGDCECNAGFWGSWGNCTACALDRVSNFDTELESGCECVAGTFGLGDNEDCRVCAVGSYKNHTSNELCTNCSLGETTLQNRSLTDSSCVCKPGWQFRYGCEPCPYATYKDFAGDASCVACQPYSNTTLGGQSVEDCLCLPGYHGNSSGCEPCAVDTYKDTLGFGLCLACPSNSSVNATGSDAVQDCACLAGYYGPRGGPCLACPEHSLSLADSANITSCECVVGYRGPDGGPCEKCYKPDGPSYFEADGCTWHCTVDSYFDGNWTCVQCPRYETSVGWWLGVGQTCELRCRSGYWAWNGVWRANSTSVGYCVANHWSHQQALGFSFDAQNSHGRWLLNLTATATDHYIVLFHSNSSKDYRSSEGLRYPCHHVSCLGSFQSQFETFTGPLLSSNLYSVLSSAPRRLLLNYSHTQMRDLGRCRGKSCHLRAGALFLRPNAVGYLQPQLQQFVLQFGEYLNQTFSVITRHTHSTLKRIQGVAKNDAIYFDVALQQSSAIDHVQYSIHSIGTVGNYTPIAIALYNSTVYQFSVPWTSRPPFAEISLYFEILQPFSRVHFHLDAQQAGWSARVNRTEPRPYIGLLINEGHFWSPRSSSAEFVSGSGPLAVLVQPEMPFSILAFVSPKGQLLVRRNTAVHPLARVSLDCTPDPWFDRNELLAVFHAACSLGKVLYYWDPVERETGLFRVELEFHL